VRPWDNEVAGFDGLLVDFAAAVGASVIVKGLGAMTDFDYEIQLSQMNRHLSGIVTMFVATKPEWGYISSSLVKEVSALGGSVDELVPKVVARPWPRGMENERRPRTSKQESSQVPATTGELLELVDR
jgi:pantetheine-phosphate adenylyltransferase